MHHTVMMLHPGANVLTRFGSASLANIKIQYTKHMCPFKRTKHSSCADAVPTCPITTHKWEKTDHQLKSSYDVFVLTEENSITRIVS